MAYPELQSEKLPPILLIGVPWRSKKSEKPRFLGQNTHNDPFVIYTNICYYSFVIAIYGIISVCRNGCSVEI